MFVNKKQALNLLIAEPQPPGEIFILYGVFVIVQLFTELNTQGSAWNWLKKEHR